MFVFQHGGDFYACVGGRLSVQPDRQRMDRYWNAAVGAWHPEGKDDPRLTMLCLEARDAEVWIAEAGPVRYAFEVAKANARGSTSDVADHPCVNLH